jgi:hypothetical protein
METMLAAKCDKCSHISIPRIVASLIWKNYSSSLTPWESTAREASSKLNNPAFPKVYCSLIVECKRHRGNWKY